MSSQTYSLQQEFVLTATEFETLKSNNQLVVGAKYHIVEENNIAIFTIETTDWTALSDSSPYTYSATVTSTITIGANTVVELINDNAVSFANYGFAIGEISGQNITIYALDTPSASVSLKIAIGG